MSRTRLRIFTLVLSIAAVAPGLANADAGEIIGAYHEMDDALDKLETLSAAAKEAMSGKMPDFHSDWTKLAAAYDKATADIKAAPMPTDLKPTTNIVSVAELTNCPTRALAIARLNSYTGDLESTQKQGNDSAAEIDKLSVRADAAKQQVDYLVSVYEKLKALPIAENPFWGDYLALSGSVGKAVADWKQALATFRRKNDFAGGACVGAVERA